MAETEEHLRAKRNVLVIEDDKAVRGLIAEFLDTPSRHWQITEVNTLQGAIALLECGFRPDVAILDLNLPNGAGLSVLRRIVEAGGDFPFVIVSGFFPEEQWGDSARAISPRVHSYFEKTLLSRALLNGALRSATFAEFVRSKSGAGILHDLPMIVSSSRNARRLRALVGPFMGGVVAATGAIALGLALVKYGAKPELLAAIAADAIAVGIAILRRVFVGKEE